MLKTDLEFHHPRDDARDALIASASQRVDGLDITDFDVADTVDYWLALLWAAGFMVVPIEPAEPRDAA